MGRRLDGFDIELEFNADGGISKVSYYDQAGCGKQEEVRLSDTIADVVGMHLVHYHRSHEMEPPRKCKFQVEIGGEPVRCTREPHMGDGPHELEVPE
jgi:hypothetical protein